MARALAEADKLTAAEIAMVQDNLVRLAEVAQARDGGYYHLDHKETAKVISCVLKHPTRIVQLKVPALNAVKPFWKAILACGNGLPELVSPFAIRARMDDFTPPPPQDEDEDVEEQKQKVATKAAEMMSLQTQAFTTMLQNMSVGGFLNTPGGSLSVANHAWNPDPQALCVSGPSNGPAMMGSSSSSSSAAPRERAFNPVVHGYGSCKANLNPRHAAPAKDEGSNTATTQSGTATVGSKSMETGMSMDESQDPINLLLQKYPQMVETMEGQDFVFNGEKWIPFDPKKAEAMKPSNATTSSNATSSKKVDETATAAPANEKSKSSVEDASQVLKDLFAEEDEDKNGKKAVSKAQPKGKAAAAPAAGKREKEISPKEAEKKGRGAGKKQKPDTGAATKDM
eukprot:g15695.t1